MYKRQFSDPNQAYCYHTGALCNSNSPSPCGEGDYCTNDFQHLLTILYTADDGTPMKPFVIDSIDPIEGDALTPDVVENTLAEYGAETSVNNAIDAGYIDLFECWSGETGACPENSDRRRRRLLHRSRGGC